MNINSVNPTIIIVGAGPTGLIMGSLLGIAGIETLILEANPTLSDSPKAIALDDEGLRICQAAALSDAVISNMLLDIHAHYISAGRILAKVAPTTHRNGYPLISTFHQPQFEATLLHGLNRFPSVNICFQHTLETFKQTTDSVTATVRTANGTLQEIQCSYLLACDGAKSSIRHALNIPMHGTTFAQKWLVVDSIDDQDPSTVATFYCNPQRPAVTVPAPDHRRRWEFMLLPGEKEQDFLYEENIHALIQQHAGSSHPQIIRRTIYTFHATLATHFSKERIFLLGDAAHLMPPFGGQGMNSGLRDAHNLSWKLELVLQGLASPALLNSYHQERHAHSAQMIRLSSLLGNIVMPTAAPIALFRDLLFGILYAIPATREFLTEARLKPQPRYKQGFMLSGHRGQMKQGIHSAIRGLLPSPNLAAIVGLMLPQPQVITSQGKRILLDEALGKGFALLRLHDDPSKAFASVKAQIWQHLSVRFVCVQPNDQIPTASDTCIVVGDIQREISKFLQHNPHLLILVRPDRYIFGVFTEQQAEDFALAFQGLLNGVMGVTEHSPPMSR